MKTIVLASRKGGAGKTTNTRHLAVLLAKMGKKVLAIDTDTQGTFTRWLTLRNNRGIEDFQLLTVPYEKIREAVVVAEQAGYEYLLIDTPPDSSDAIKSTVCLADLVLIPCKASPDDLGAVSETYELVKQLDKPFAFIINEAKARTILLSLAMEYLSQKGPLAPTQYDYIAIPAAAATGHTVMDLEPLSKPAVAVQRLLDYILAQLGE